MPSKSNSSSTKEQQYTTTNRRLLVLNSESDLDLWEMFYYAGVTIDPQVFHVILDLIKLDIHPKVIIDTLTAVIPNSKYHVKKDTADAIPKVESRKSKSDSVLSSGKRNFKTGSKDTGSGNATRVRKPSGTREKSLDSRSSKSSIN